MSKGLGKRGGVPFKRLTFKKWTVEHESIVLAHISGRSGIEISKLTGFHEQHISNIINSTNAQVIIEGVRKRLPHEEVSERSKALALKAFERLETFISNDAIFQSSPIMAIDKALKITEAFNTSANIPTRNVLNTGTTINILATEAVVNKLFDAMNKTNEVDRIHGNGIPDLKLVGSG